MNTHGRRRLSDHSHRNRPGLRKERGGFRRAQAQMGPVRKRGRSVYMNPSARWLGQA